MNHLQAYTFFIIQSSENSRLIQARPVEFIHLSNACHIKLAKFIHRSPIYSEEPHPQFPGELIVERKQILADLGVYCHMYLIPSNRARASQGDTVTRRGEICLDSSRLPHLFSLIITMLRQMGHDASDKYRFKSHNHNLFSLPRAPHSSPLRCQNSTIVMSAYVFYNLLSAPAYYRLRS